MGHKWPMSTPYRSLIEIYISIKCKKYIIHNKANKEITYQSIIQIDNIASFINTKNKCMVKQVNFSKSDMILCDSEGSSHIPMRKLMSAKFYIQVIIFSFSLLSPYLLNHYSAPFFYNLHPFVSIGKICLWLTKRNEVDLI